MGASVDQRSLRTPTAEDLVPQRHGPRLSGAEYVDLTRAGAGEERELGEDDVTPKVRAIDAKITACIDRARGDYRLSEGRVVVRFRIERSGKVAGVQVEAPAILQQQGLYGCLRPLISGLVFPASARANVMTYPYMLR